MFTTKITTDVSDTDAFTYIWGLVIATLVVLSVGVYWWTKAENVATQAVIQYEDFQVVYNTCEKLNADLCNLRALPANDPSFAQFSQATRINAVKGQLDRWIQDYNGKSQMITRSLWKSNNLPYQLSNTQYSCYQENKR